MLEPKYKMIHMYAMGKRKLPFSLLQKWENIGTVQFQITDKYVYCVVWTAAKSVDCFQRLKGKSIRYI